MRSFCYFFGSSKFISLLISETDEIVTAALKHHPLKSVSSHHRQQLNHRHPLVKNMCIVVTNLIPMIRIHSPNLHSVVMMMIVVIAKDGYGVSLVSLFPCNLQFSQFFVLHVCSSQIVAIPLIISQ